MLGSGRETLDLSELSLSNAAAFAASTNAASRFKSIKLLLLPDDDGSGDGSFEIIKSNHKRKTEK